MCSPVDWKRQSVDQFLVGNHLVLTARYGALLPLFRLVDLLLPDMRAGLLARFLLQGLGSTPRQGRCPVLQARSMALHAGIFFRQLEFATRAREPIEHEVALYVTRCGVPGATRDRQPKGSSYERRSNCGGFRC